MGKHQTKERRKMIKHGMVDRYLRYYKTEVPGGFYSENYKNYYQIWKQLDLKLKQ